MARMTRGAPSNRKPAPPRHYDPSTLELARQLFEHYQIVILNPRLSTSEQSLVTMDLDWWTDYMNHIAMINYLDPPQKDNPRGG